MSRRRSKMCGVYEIRCVANGKVYIGSARDIEKRWSGHKASLRAGTHGNPLLERAVRKYGLGSLEFSVVELCSIEDLHIVEQEYIDAVPKRLIMNCQNAAVSKRHFRRSVEARKRVAEAHGGRKVYAINLVSGEERDYHFMSHCADDGFTTALVHKVLMGERTHHKNWTFSYEKGVYKTGKVDNQWFRPLRVVVLSTREEATVETIEDLKTMGFSAGNVRLVLAGKRASHKGAFFMYQDSPTAPPIAWDRQLVMKAVTRTDAHGNSITFKSMAEAIAATPKALSGRISEASRKNGRHAGFLWSRPV